MGVLHTLPCVYASIRLFLFITKIKVSKYFLSSVNCSSNLINFKEGVWNHSTTASLSEPQVIVGVYGWHLKYLVGFQEWGSGWGSCRNEPLNCGFRLEVNSRTLSWLSESAWWVRKHPHLGYAVTVEYPPYRVLQHFVYGVFCAVFCELSSFTLP